MPTAKTILTRIVFGAVMIAVLGGVLAVEYLRPWTMDLEGAPLALVLIVLCVMGLRELRRMAKSAGAGLLSVSATLGTLAIATKPIWHKFSVADVLVFGDIHPLRFAAGTLADDAWCMIGLIVAAMFLEQMIRYRLDGALARLGMTALAVAYLGVGAAIVLAIRIQYGVPALVLFLAAVKGTDIGAYFTGSAIGRHKLIPWLSPGKSWEGLVGGLATGAGAAMLVAWAFEMDLSLGAAAAVGAILGVAGQFADLCESLLKRSASVKDSASLVPEFGGVLDVVDSPLLAAPAAWVLLNMLL
jgi:phosphatidate cytidylyltransferase